VEVNSTISSAKLLYSSIVVLLGRHISFSPLHHQMEKGKRKEEDSGCALVVWEAGWHNILVVVMILSHYISSCDRALPLGVIIC